LSPPPIAELEEVPSSTKVTAKKGRKLHFSSPTPTTSTKGMESFTRSSTLKEDVEAKVLPKVSIEKKKKDKGKGIERPIEVIDIASVQQIDKGESMDKFVEIININ
jgi:hypothetical protein